MQKEIETLYSNSFKCKIIILMFLLQKRKHHQVVFWHSRANTFSVQ